MVHFCRTNHRLRWYTLLFNSRNCHFHKEKKGRQRSCSYISNSIEQRKLLPCRLFFFIFPYTLHFSSKSSWVLFLYENYILEQHCIWGTLLLAVLLGKSLMDSNINMINLLKYFSCLQNDWLNIVHVYIIDGTINRLVAECCLFKLKLFIRPTETNGIFSGKCQLCCISVNTDIYSWLFANTDT